MNNSDTPGGGLPASAAHGSAGGRGTPAGDRGVAEFLPRGRLRLVRRGHDHPDRHGSLYVSLTTWGLYNDTVDPPLMTSNMGKIWKVTPRGVQTLVATQDLTPNGMLLGMATHRGRLYVALYDMGAGTNWQRCLPGRPRHHAHPGRLTARGRVAQQDRLHGGRLYVTDSATGANLAGTAGQRRGRPGQAVAAQREAGSG